MFKILWIMCCFLTIVFWIGDSSDMRDNLQKETVVNGDTLKIVDNTTWFVPFPQTYTLSDGSSIRRELAEDNLIVVE